MENIDIMSNEELDIFARKVFTVSNESGSYTSPVSLMYGIGLESAYDDSFFSRLMRGLGRATAFTNASKVRAALKDIRHLSIDKISDGETSGVSVDRKTLAMSANFIKSFGGNINKSEKMINEYKDDLKKLLSDKEFKNALEHEIRNLKDGSAVKVAIRGILQVMLTTSTIYLSWIVAPIIALSIPLGIFAFPLGFYIGISPILLILLNLAYIINTLWLLLNYEEVSAEFKAIIREKIKNLNAKGEKVFKSISGVSLDGNGDGFISKYSEMLNFEPSKDKTISKEEKVQVVQGLIALSDNEGEMIKALDLSKLKEVLKTFNKLKDVTSKLNNRELNNIITNTAKIQGAMYKLVDSSLKIILAALNDAKKY